VPQVRGEDEMKYYNDNGEPAGSWVQILTAIMILALLVYLTVMSIAQAREIQRQKSIIFQINRDYERIKERFGIWPHEDFE
jgi:predicted membrane channel-forming protein YqfA (hemolysin III family)